MSAPVIAAAAAAADAARAGEPPAGGTAPAPGPVGGRGRLSDRTVHLLVILGGLLLYLPFAGSYGLYDPWETHYGEVARQMAVRGDWISLWWPGSPIDGEHFWSKPVLTFWLMAMVLRLTGIAAPDAPPGGFATSHAVEWALRLPFCVLGALGAWAVHLAVSRLVSRRAGVLAALVTATMPLYALVSRQAMTDMPFIAPMTLALALGALALFEDDDAELPRRAWGRLSWPAHPLFYAAIGLFTLTALPQIVVDAVQLRWPLHLGGHAFDLPGIVPMAPYLVGFVAFLLLAARTRYKAPLYLYIAAILCALAMLAKGLAGLGLPVIVFIAYLLATGSWRRLDRAQIYFGILVAMLACAVVSFPWHHAMIIRHGRPFWDELYGDNHWRRLVMGRHGDRGTFEYFIRELGYAALPWIALVPTALMAALLRRPGATPAEERRRQILWLGGIWFVGGYALVSLSMTKFHHYILPALPGLGIVLGLTLDELIERGPARRGALAALVGVPLLAVVIQDLAGARHFAQHFIWLFSYDYINTPKGRPWPDRLDFGPALIGFAVAFAAATAALGIDRLRRLAVAGLCTCAIAFTVFLLDGYLRKVTPYWTQKGLIATYYEQRKGPDEPLISWQMYWRGENFYTKNAIYEGPADERTVFLGDKNAENLKAYFGRKRGKRVFFVVERNRWGTLQGLLPEDARSSLKMIDESNMKFCLASAQL